METGEWAQTHRRRAADLLTKALPHTRFCMLVGLLGVGPGPPRSRSAKIIPRMLRRDMLKGCEASTLGPESSESVWIWLLAIAFRVILLWEGAKTVASPCLKALRFEE